jgi:hypothetical protein
MSVGQISVGQMSVGQMSVGQMFVFQMYVFQMYVGQMSVGQMSVGQTSVGQWFFDQKQLQFVANIFNGTIECQYLNKFFFHFYQRILSFRH